MTETPHIINLPVIPNNDCSLGVTEASKHCGFNVKRHYYLLNGDGSQERGQHAHKALKQFMVCLSGNALVALDNGENRFEFKLDDPSKGLFVPPGYWRDIELSANAIFSVLASEEYHEEDYIRDYDEFKSWLKDKDQIQHVPYIALNRCHDEFRFDLECIFTKELQSNDLILGDSVTHFEQNFAVFCGVKHAVGCGNGLDALSLILRAMNIGDGDEVIVPANSFIASALAVEYAGACSVFVDCDPSTYSIAIDQIEAAITSKTKAIIAVHLYGIPTDMTSICEIAKRHNLYVIEDAAQAHGAEYKGCKVGSLGDAAAFSFYPTKNMGAMGDAGCIVTNDDSIAEKARILGNYGARKKYYYEMAGFNSRLDSLQASILDLKLKHIERWNECRRTLARIYLNELCSIEEIVLPEWTQDSKPVWHVFPIRVYADVRDQFIDFLNKNGVGTNIHYPVSIHKSLAYDRSEHLKYSEAFADTLVSLPLDAYHTEEEILYVVKIIKQFFEA